MKSEKIKVRKLLDGSGLQASPPVGDPLKFLPVWCFGVGAKVMFDGKAQMIVEYVRGDPGICAVRLDSGHALPGFYPVQQEATA